MKRAMPFGHCKDITFIQKRGLDNIKLGLKIVNYTFFQPNLSVFQPKSHFFSVFCWQNYRFLEYN